MRDLIGSMALTRPHQPRILPDEVSIRHDPALPVDVIQQSPESSGSPFTRVNQSRTENTTGNPNDIIEITINESDPSSVDSAFSPRAAHIKRRKSEPREHRHPGTPLREQQAPISTPYSLKTVLRRKTLTAQTVGMLSSTINIASSERSNPLVNGSSICRASRAIQMAPTTATGTARHRMSTERRRISRPSGICVVHPRSDASPPERPTVKPPEEDFLPPSPDILT